ncbi:MAG: glycosyltransferase [Terrimonas sp.]|nr:glycosyltransferase [Terrimonas sp.]
MKRICGTLADAGYEVTLTGRKRKTSLPLSPASYQQTRLQCFFTKGILFYAEFNTRLFFYLLFKKCDCICAIDLDTILPCYGASKLKGVQRVYDAHEYFSQMEEVISRPLVYKFWHWVEQKMIPRFPKGYTVCGSIADEFKHLYHVHYAVVRNVPVVQEEEPVTTTEKYILYQGAVNKGRGLVNLIQAMKSVPCPLVICGDGNAMDEVKEAIILHGLENKIKLTGMLPPEKLKEYTRNAYMAVNTFQRQGLNQYFSLANKFFDYIHAGIPQVTMNYPEYRRINEEYDIALLIEDINPETIAQGLNKMLNDNVLFNRLQANMAKARKALNWNNEQSVLLNFYAGI